MGLVKLCNVLAENGKRRVTVSQNNENQKAAYPSITTTAKNLKAEENCSKTKGYVHTLPYIGVMPTGEMRPGFLEELTIPSLCKELGKAEFIPLPHRACMVRIAGTHPEPPATGLQPHVSADPIYLSCGTHGKEKTTLAKCCNDNLCARESLPF